MDHATLARPKTGEARDDTAQPDAAGQHALQLRDAAPVRRLAAIGATLNGGVVQALTNGGSGPAAGSASAGETASQSSTEPVRTGDGGNAGGAAASGPASATATATATATTSADTRSAPIAPPLIIHARPRPAGAAASAGTSSASSSDRATGGGHVPVRPPGWLGSGGAPNVAAADAAEAARAAHAQPGSGGAAWVPHKGTYALPPTPGPGVLTPDRALMHAHLQVVRAQELAQLPRLQIGQLDFSSGSRHGAAAAERSLYFGAAAAAAGGQHAAQAPAPGTLASVAPGAARVRLHHDDGPMISPLPMHRFTLRPRAGAAGPGAAGAGAGYHGERDYIAWAQANPNLIGTHYPQHMLKPAALGDRGQIFEIGPGGYTHKSRSAPQAEANIRTQGHLDRVVAAAHAGDIALVGYRAEERAARHQVNRIIGEIAVVTAELANFPAPAASASSSRPGASAGAAAAASAGSLDGISAGVRTRTRARLVRKLGRLNAALQGARHIHQWAQAQLRAAAGPHNRAIDAAYAHAPAAGAGANAAGAVLSATASSGPGSGSSSSSAPGAVHAGPPIGPAAHGGPGAGAGGVPGGEWRDGRFLVAGGYGSAADAYRAALAGEDVPGVPVDRAPAGAGHQAGGAAAPERADDIRGMPPPRGTGAAAAAAASTASATSSSSANAAVTFTHPSGAVTTVKRPPRPPST